MARKVVAVVVSGCSGRDRVRRRKETSRERRDAAQESARRGAPQRRARQRPRRGGTGTDLHQPSARLSQYTAVLVEPRPWIQRPAGTRRWTISSTSSRESSRAARKRREGHREVPSSHRIPRSRRRREIPGLQERRPGPFREHGGAHHDRLRGGQEQAGGGPSLETRRPGKSS